MKSQYTIITLLITGLFLITVLNSCSPRFGRIPKGDNLDRIKKSPNYKEGEFKNLIKTSVIKEDVGTLSMMKSMMFEKNDRLVPEESMTVVKTDLKALKKDQNILVWLGHSSWYLQLNGKRILIDPILNTYAAPVSFANKAFKGTNIYSAEDMPEIDYLVISHDHYDHLDYKTIRELKNKVKHVITPLGIGATFEYWKYPKDKIIEADWNDEIKLEKNFSIHVLPARHYSGRLFKKNQTLWAAFAFVTPEKKIFYSGDSGYGPHFSDISKTFKGFDIVLIDCGQYDPKWPDIHMTPEEAEKAANELNAGIFIPSHIGRFSIANHSWDDPYIRLTANESNNKFKLVTPQIGEVLDLDKKSNSSNDWWKTQSSK